MLAGGFVAGNHAGLTYETFPLMDGRLLPAGYAELSPFLRNLTENVAAVQFDHRLLATLSGLLAAATVAAGLRDPRRAGDRAVFVLLGAAAASQYALGVATLVWGVPVALAVAHQVTAVLLLTAALAAVHVLRPARGGPPGRRARARDSGHGIEHGRPPSAGQGARDAAAR
jgi:cytochrome c oxidase assembly protein subunit 15